MIGMRAFGDTDIFSKPKNYNFELRRKNEEKMRHKLIALGVALSFVPIFMLATNAEKTFKKTGVKEVSSQRRERLDKEHGIDREKMT